ncbi:MAG: tRNA pseudouridine(38-40) synthase TruA [Deltaproteobacteria bacterium]|nr:tRNA pseudouridine(38-40) synthase TruA [Deltaproteobacteria bacterium]
MRRLRLVLEYEGTDFAGFQVQPGRRSVQGVVEQALREITGESRRIVPAGRTDAGVHARAQVAHVDSESRLSADELVRALNARLPADVAVTDLAIAAPDFHARKSATGKLYAYRILNRADPSALRARYSWHVRGALDVASMQRAAIQLVGSHDFSAFRTAPGGPPEHERPRRTLYRVEVLRTDDDEVRLEILGRSFLRQMVRNLVGTLVEIGQGRRPAAELAAILASCDRSRAAQAAPAHGLCLERVLYDEDPA